jgi:hypothetical protein
MASAKGLKGQPWRLLSEGVIIFLGVAAALAGQAWFESRSDRVAERDLLVNLHEELVANESVLPEMTASLEEHISDAFAIVDAFAAEDSPERTATLVQMAPLLAAVPVGDLRTTALDEAIGSGNLRLLKSSDLRLELSRLRERIRIARLWYDSQQRFVENYVRPYALEHLRVLDFEWGWSREARDPPPARFTVEAAALGDSPYFENLAAYSLFKYRDVLVRLDEVSTSLAEVRAAVEQEIAAF